MSPHREAAGSCGYAEGAHRRATKLKPPCADTGISYGERVARRKVGIESLGEALKILNGDDIAVFMQK